MKLAAILRAVLLLLLLAAFFLRRERGSSDHAFEVVEVADAAGAARLLTDSPPDLVVRRATRAPTSEEVQLFAAISRRTPLAIALPGTLLSLRAESPTGSIPAGRAIILNFSLRGEVGDRQWVRLLQSDIVTDSVEVAIGASGEETGAFRVRPEHSGWHEWRIAAGDVEAGAGAWVTEARPLRVLLVSGPPNWETRFAARALEEAGASVALVQSLGGGIQIGGDIPGSLEALGDFDVVMLLGPVPWTEGLGALLAEFASEGGGVLAAGPGSALSAVALADSARSLSVDGSAIDWGVPAELSALPELSRTSAAEVMFRLRPGTVAFASTGEGATLLATRAYGRGRVAGLGLRETWRWRMEGGHVAEHRDLWRSLAEWLAGGISDSMSLALSTTSGPLLTPVDVHLSPAMTGRLPRLQLHRPGGDVEELTLGQSADGASVKATFLPAEVGVHSILVDEDSTARVAFVAQAADTDTEPAGWAQLAMLAHQSGGAALTSDSLNAWVAGREADESNGDPGRTPEVLLLALVLGVSFTEWTIRRLGGLP